MSIMRLTGPVSVKGVREGISKGSGKPYALPYAVISLGDFTHTEVTLADSLVDRVSEGDVVDLIVDVTSSGGYLRAMALNTWPENYATAPKSSPKPLAATG